jgi:4-hydroxy-tetrahydrodipicolinate synthase
MNQFTTSAQTSPPKQWAQEHYKGIENLLMPSFSPDFKSLDAAGIQNDVRNSIRHGFFSVTCIPVGVTTEEHKTFLKITCEEARGRILAGDIVAEATLQDDLDMIAYAETVGCTHLLLAPGRSLQAKTEEELYQGYLQRINATSLPIILYGSVSEAYKAFGPSGVPLRVFDRLADLPNVVGIKLSQPMSLTTAFQICEQLGSRLLVGPVNLDFVPLLARHYRVQWSGQWNVESVQSPEKPFAVELMQHLNDREFDKALSAYARLEPALKAFYQLQAPLILKGLHPWVHMKYFQWCVGGNGGLMRKLPGHHGNVPVLDAAARDRIQKTYRTIGIDPVTAPEAAFVVGRAAYDRGVRLQDMIHKPYYT